MAAFFNMFHVSRFTFQDRRSQAALSLVFLIGGIVVVVSVTIAFLVTSFISVSSGFEAAERAAAVASAGADDGLLQLLRNKAFSDTGGYPVPLGSYSALVTVTQNTPTAGQVTIISTATVLGNHRRVKVVVSVDETTGKASILSRETVSL